MEAIDDKKLMYRKMWNALRGQKEGTSSYRDAFYSFASQVTSSPSKKSLFHDLGFEKVVSDSCRFFVAETLTIVKNDLALSSRITSSSYADLIFLLRFCLDPQNSSPRGACQAAEIMENLNFFSASLSLLALTFSHAQSGTVTDGDWVIACDQQLSLLGAVLACAPEKGLRRVLVEHAGSENLMKLLKILPQCLDAPFEGSAHISESVLSVFHHLFSVLSAEKLELCEATLLTALMRPCGRVQGLESNRLCSLACLLESINLLKQRRGYGFPETLNFGAIVTLLSSCEAALSPTDPNFMRILNVISALATASRPHVEKETSTLFDIKKASILTAVPATLSGLQNFFTSLASSRKTPSPSTEGIQCREAIECLTTLFICMLRHPVSAVISSTLFPLLGKCDDDLISFVLNSCIESVEFFTVDQLNSLFTSLGSVKSEAVLLRFTDALCKVMRAGKISDAMQKLTMINFFMELSSRSVNASTYMLDMGLISCYIPSLREDTCDYADHREYLNKVLMLSKVLMNHYSVESKMDLSVLTLHILEELIHARRSGAIETAAILRDLFSTFGAKDKDIYFSVMCQLMSASEEKPWGTHVSLLLFALMTLLRNGKGQKNAIQSNCVEVMLCMLRLLPNSQNVVLDMHLIGCTLGNTLPVVKHSKVWERMQLSISQMPMNRENAEFLFRLLSGFYQSSIALNLVDSFFVLQDLTEVEHIYTTTIPKSTYQPSIDSLVHSSASVGMLTSWFLEKLDPSSSHECDFLLNALDSFLLSCQAKFDHEMIARYVSKFQRHHIIPIIANVSSSFLRDLFFSPIDSLESLILKQEVWRGALQTSKRWQKAYSLQLLQSGGLHGAFPLSGMVWPPIDGYSVGTWVFWESATSEDSPERACYLWQMEWSVNNAATCGLKVNPSEGKCYFACRGLSEDESIEIPFISPSTWTHVVICHGRSNVFSSILRVYYNGTLVQSSPCTYPLSSLHLAVGVASAGANISVQEKNELLRCTIGCPLGAVASSISTHFLSWRLYTAVLVPSEVESLYALPCYVSKGGHWGASGIAHVSLAENYLSESTLSMLSLYQTRGKLLPLIESGSVTMALPSVEPLIHIHTNTLCFCDASFSYFSNKEPAFPNLSGDGTFFFRPHGKYAIPSSMYASRAATLIAMGGHEEWVRWMRYLETSTSDDKFKAVSGALEIFVSALQDSDLVHNTWGPFLCFLASFFRAHPRTFLSDPRTVELLLDLATKKIKGNDHRNSDDVYLVLFFTTPAEQILFNWEILSRLPYEILDHALNHIFSLFSKDNPFCFFNAYRAVAASFVNGFICGLFREYLHPYIRQRAVTVIQAFFEALPQFSGTVDKVLTICAVSIPTGNLTWKTVGVHLFSKFSYAGRAYIEAVRNDLLKAINSAFDCLDNSLKPRYASCLGKSVTEGWLSAMLSPNSHPVTVCLALRILMICLWFDSSFAQRLPKDSILYLSQLLRAYSGYPEIADIVICGSTRTLWNLNGDLTSLESLPIDSRSFSMPLFELAMRFFADQAQALNMDKQRTFEYASFKAYFSSSPLSCEFHKRNLKLKRCVHALIFVSRLRSLHGATENADIIPEAANILFCRPEDDTRQACVTILNWLASSYDDNPLVRGALYSDESILNLLDVALCPHLYGFAKLNNTAVETNSSTSEIEIPERTENVGRSSSSLESRAQIPFWKRTSRSFSPQLDENPFGYQYFDAFVSSRTAGSTMLSCKLLYMTHARYLARIYEVSNSDLHTYRSSKFTLSLHRSLSISLSGAGNYAEDWRACFLCSIWMHAIHREGSKNEMGIERNAVSLAQYLVDRLVSGCAVPVAAIFFFLTHLIGWKLSLAHEQIIRKLFLDWFLYVASAEHHGADPEVLHDMGEMLSNSPSIIFSAPAPTEEVMNAIIFRLIGFSLALLLSTKDDSSSRSLQHLRSLWNAFMLTNASSSFGNRLSSSPISRQLTFAEWKMWLQEREAETRSSLNIKISSSYSYFCLAQGEKHLRSLKKGRQEVQEESLTLQRQLSIVTERAEKACKNLYQAEIFIDPDCVSASPTCFVRSISIYNPDALPQKQFASVALNECFVCLSEFPNHVNVDRRLAEPLSYYIRFPPPICQMTESEEGLSVSGLSGGASTVIRKICGSLPSSQNFWVGNIYFILGCESLVATLFLTPYEIIILTCSELTKTGSFLVAQIRPRAAAKQSKIKATFLHEALGRFIRKPLGQGVTSTKAAFKHSQYYRQLKTESSSDSSPLVFRFFLGNVSSIHQRTFQHLPAALEFVLETGERFFVVTLDEELSFSMTNRDRLLHAISECHPHIQTFTTASKKSSLNSSTAKWLKRGMSNYEYLQCLNDCASRTLADIGQYPVFPWILSNYTAGSLDLSERSSYRDLSKPIGAINHFKAIQLRERYDTWISDTEPPFHFGTHYSSSAVVLYYLVRLQPYTSRSIEYQGGKLDLAERLFHSVSEAWESSSGAGTGDVKELIPEFFAMPEFLLNRNHTTLGRRRDGVVLGDVIIPDWCGGSVGRFIHFNRLALENEVTTESLHKWIDLIFGYKQQGDEAVRAVNVFHHLSYREGVERAISAASNEEQKISIVASADSFGQTPKQLFKQPHPQVSLSNLHRPKQDMIIANLSSIVRSNMSCIMAYGRERKRKREPIHTIYWNDGSLYASSENFVATFTTPIQVFSLNPNHLFVVCKIFREPHPITVISSPEIFSCGRIRSLFILPTGNILACGTYSGSVLVYTRRGLYEPFQIMSVLCCPFFSQRSVSVGKLFNDGQLIIAYDGEESYISSWHLSFLETMFSFSINLSSENDSTPVSDFARDEATKNIWIAKFHSLTLITPNGQVLYSVDLLSYTSSILSTLKSEKDPISNEFPPIKAVSYFNCLSFSTRNILALGHIDGTVSFWILESQKKTSANELFTLVFCTTVSCHEEISQIVPFPEYDTIAIGTTEGSVITFDIGSKSEN